MNYFFRATPSHTNPTNSGIYVLTCFLSGMHTGVLLNMSSDILSGDLSGFLFRALSDILSGIPYGVPSGNYSRISKHFCGALVLAFDRAS